MELSEVKSTASTSHVWSMCLLLPYVAVDGKNPANQLRLIVYPNDLQGVFTSQLVVWDF